MKGNNTIVFNTATMMEIVQYYFDKRLYASGQAPKVTDVKRSSNSIQPTFDIETGEQNEKVDTA